MNKGHVHAELMAQYAEDAKETDRPWERWEVRGTDTWFLEWSTLSVQPNWSERLSYRRKPTRVKVAGEVFEDVVLDPQVGQEKKFYVIDRELNSSVYSVSPRKAQFIADSVFREGRVHTTYDGAMRHLEAIKPKVL